MDGSVAAVVVKPHAAMPSAKVTDAQAGEMAKQAGGKALELGKKGLSTGKEALQKAKDAGILDIKNWKDFTTSLFLMINTLKGDVSRVTGGQVTAKDALLNVFKLNAGDPDGGFKFMYAPVEEGLARTCSSALPIVASLRTHHHRATATPQERAVVLDGGARLLLCIPPF